MTALRIDVVTLFPEIYPGAARAEHQWSRA